MNCSEISQSLTASSLLAAGPHTQVSLKAMLDLDHYFHDDFGLDSRHNFAEISFKRTCSLNNIDQTGDQYSPRKKNKSGWKINSFSQGFKINLKAKPSNIWINKQTPPLHRRLLSERRSPQSWWRAWPSCFDSVFIYYAMVIGNLANAIIWPANWP